MNPRTIHETELKEILSTIFNAALDVSDKMGRNHPSSMSTAYSLSRATSATTLVFPVLVSESISSESASMVSKAIERKCVSLMQLALSAFNMNGNVDNIVDFIKDFHVNADPKKLDLDNFESIANTIASHAGINESCDYRAIAAVAEDCKNNLNYYFDDDLNDKSLSEFAFKRNGLTDVVMEIKRPKDQTVDGRNLPATDVESEKTASKEREKLSKSAKDQRDYNLKAAQFQHQIDNDIRKDEYQREKDRKNDEYQSKRDQIKDDRDLRQDNNNYFKSQLLSSDIKKANELVPSMMIINVMTKSPTSTEMINQQSVIGIKAKLYPVNPNETVTKIVTKHSDSNTLMKLVKVGTREISFFKDFLLAIDDAKIEALSKSKRGSSSKLFKVLERRALGGKVRKVMGKANTCKPIFSLVISREEADYLLNYNDVDVDNPKTVIPIMEKLNLMYFVILDESTETAKFLVDGDTEYETLSFSSLEKEVSDGGYKKVVNLMSRMTR